MRPPASSRAWRTETVGSAKKGKAALSDAQLGVAQRELERAEARVAEVDRVFGDDAVVGGVLEREHERGGQIPGAVLQVGGDAPRA